MVFVNFYIAITISFIIIYIKYTFIVIKLRVFLLDSGLKQPPDLG